MINKITDTEYRMLKNYRDWYAWDDEPSANCVKRPIREILTEWEASNRDLYKLLGENLIITKNVSFKKSLMETQREINKMVSKYSNYGSENRNQREGWKFYEDYMKWIAETYPHYYGGWLEDISKEDEEKNAYNDPIRHGLVRLIDTNTLAKNEYDFESFTFNLPNGRPYTVQRGCKPMRVLAKLADAFQLEGFEDFRICHSQVHNQKKVVGKLSLSIHPLDYWTMSDNACGWDSCMSWRSPGGYRQGTVEMMNSPCVVVAYLSSSTQMDIGDDKWNSKKWRCLYIVDKGVILSVKAYPYANEHLNELAIKWIKELAEENLGWKYLAEEPVPYSYDTRFAHPEREEKFRISFSSDNMYTDVGSAPDHRIYIGECLDVSRIYGNLYHFNYSGASQCVSCGETDPDIDNECCLVCDRCETSMRCSECGDRIYDGNYYTVAGQHLCEYCYNDNTSRCGCCEEDYFNENVMDLRILLPIDDEVEQYCEENFTSVYSDSDQHCVTLGEITICDNCYSKLKQDDMKPDTKPIIYYDIYHCCHYGIFINDLKKETLENYVGYYIKEDYLNGFTPLQLLKKHCGRYDHDIIHRTREDY